MSDLAKKAYDAYDAFHGVLAGRGGVVEIHFSEFEEIEPMFRQAWIAAANAVEEAISVERVP